MEWLQRIARIRRRTRGGERDPDKAVLLLYAFGLLNRQGFQTLRFREIEERFTQLLGEFGPPKPVNAGNPFHNLTGDGLWEVLTAAGGASPRPDGRALRAHHAAGRLVPPFPEQLLADPQLFAPAVRVLLDIPFEPSLH